MKESDKQRIVGQGAVYLYIESVSMMISGFAFWIIISKIATTDVIGTASAIISFAGIFSVLAGLGIYSCIQRFLGKNFSEQKMADARTFVLASIILVSVGIIITSAILIVIKDWIFDLLKIGYDLLIISLFLIASSTMMMLFRFIIISSLDTKILPIIAVISVAIKIILAIFLIMLGTGTIGLTLGVAFSQILMCILSGFAIMKIFKSSNYDKKHYDIGLTQASKTLLNSGLAFWIPVLITTIGTQLGTIVVFGSEGSNESAIYFMAITIVTGLLSVIYTLFTIALPALSSMHDGRKRFTWQAIRFSGIISLPFSTSIIFYSKDLMQLLGSSYAEGALSLEILLLSIFPTIIFSGVNDLVHAYGKYRQVLAIGLATSIPRTVLYFIFIPLYGSAGAAMAYTIGSLVGMLVSSIIGNKIGLRIKWIPISLMLIIPLAIAFLLSYLQINYIIGIAFTLFASYLILIGLKILTKTDILFSIRLLPKGISNPLINFLFMVYRRLK